MHRIEKSPDKICIIAKSLHGLPVATFETEDQAFEWLRKSKLSGKDRRVVFYKQTTTEEEVQIII